MTNFSGLIQISVWSGDQIGAFLWTSEYSRGTLGCHRGAFPAAIPPNFEDLAAFFLFFFILTILTTLIILYSHAEHRLYRPVQGPWYLSAEEAGLQQ